MISVILPLAILFSLALGALVLGGAWFLAHRSQQNRATCMIFGVLSALLVNSWWILLLGALFVKFVILREDT